MRPCDMIWAGWKGRPGVSDRLPEERSRVTELYGVLGTVVMEMTSGRPGR